MRAVWRFPVLALAAWALFGLSSPARAQNAATHTDDYFNFIEFNIYGGESDYKAISDGLGTKIDTSPIAGVRFTENIWNYVGLEQDFGAFSWNKSKFLSIPPDGVYFPPFQVHIFQPSANIVLYFTPRNHRFRPFVTAGFGFAAYKVSQTSERLASALPPAAGFGTFNDDWRVQGNYGGGIKYQANKWFGFRIDLRGYTGINPQFGLPTGPPNIQTAYIPGGKILNGIEATGGLTFYFGHRGEIVVPPPPAPPPPPPAIGAINPGAISASPMQVCPGDTVSLSSNASDPSGHQLTYQWMANGSPVGTGAQYTYMPSSSGDMSIGLHVADSTNPGRGADASPVTVHVNTYSRPVISGVTANPTELDRGQTSAVHALGMGSECSGRLTYSWAASEGAIAGTGTDAQFNSSTVAMNDADRSRPQSKQVTVTATVTDSKGGSASASTNITVNLAAEARHFGDILFTKNNARVNNCGKRVLIEQLYPALTANPNYDVVLVGHIDATEAPKGKSRRGRNLDRDRVLQTAAVLSGGSGTCSSLDPSRIKGSWIGATQDTPSVPTSCAVSTTAPTERRGAAIENTDEAKNRRVEIWLVPKGMALPAAARDAKELPDTDLKKIGCPK